MADESTIIKGNTPFRNRHLADPDELRSDAANQADEQFPEDQIYSGAATVGQVLQADGLGGADFADLTALEIDSGAATDGQVLTADGLGGSAFEDPHTMSDYANIVVVDASGNGDYATLTAAFAAEGNADYFVFGATTEPGTVVLNLDCRIMGPGRVVGDIDISGATLELDGGIEIEGDIGIDSTAGAAAELIIRNATVLGQVEVNPLDVTGLTSTLSTFGGSRIYSDALTVAAVLLPAAARAGSGILLIHAGSLIESLTGDGIDIQANTGTTILDAVNSSINIAEISGAGDAISSSVAVSPDVNLCRLVNGVHANVTLPGGGNNVIT